MAPTQPASEFQYRANRIASFTEGKKVGNTKSLKFWTSSTLSPDHLADCGFYYTPSKTYSDQVTCFWCGKKERNLDNVESVSEYHLKNWPKCPYSRIVSNLERFVKDSEKERFWPRLREKDAPISVTEPHSTSSISLRLATFKNLWKFDNRKRSKTKVTSKGLAEAGFYYSPVDHDDDRVICMYCDCPLSDWVSDDDPLVEHKKNSFVFCYFLHTLNQPKENVGSGEKETGKSQTKGRSTSRSKKEVPAAEVEDGSFPEPEAEASSKVVPDIDLNGKPVNDSDDINSSAPSISELRHQTSLDAFDFSIEDLERNDNATIFHGQDILPKRFTRKRKQDLQEEQQKKRLAAAKTPSLIPDKSTSLALKVREEDDNEEPHISIEEVVDYEYEETNNLSVMQSTLMSHTSGHESLDYQDSTFPESPDPLLKKKTKARETSATTTEKTPAAQRKKKSKSQFSDDEFDLNSHDLEAILNSPKKSRKMKVLQQDDALSIPADIYNLSNQNIGDYDESNLSYLEGNTRKKPKRILATSDAITQKIVPLKAELKGKWKHSYTIVDDPYSQSPEKQLASSMPIEIESSPQKSPRASDNSPSSDNTLRSASPRNDSSKSDNSPRDNDSKTDNKSESPGKSDITAIELVPQSSPKEPSLSEKVVDPLSSREVVENTPDAEDDLALSVNIENADSSLVLERVSENEKDTSHGVEDAIKADIEMVSSSGSPEASLVTEFPAENDTKLSPENETELPAETDSPLSGIDNETMEKTAVEVENLTSSKADSSKEIVEDSDEAEISHNSEAISDSRPSSRESDDTVGEFEVSPSSYEEYKKELQMMDSELIKTSSPPKSDDVDVDLGQLPDPGMDIDEPENDEPGPKDQPEPSVDQPEVKLKTEPQQPVGNNSVSDDISKIEETMTEDPQFIPINTSFLEKDMSTSQILDSDKQSTESGERVEQSKERVEESEDRVEASEDKVRESEDKVKKFEDKVGESDNSMEESDEVEARVLEEKVEDRVEDKVEESKNNVDAGDRVESTKALKQDHEEETGNKISAQSRPSRFFTKFVERVKALSPSRGSISPNKAKEPTVQPNEDEEKLLDRLSFLGMEASTPEKKSDTKEKHTLSMVSLDRAVQEIQVLEETIEYLVEVLATDLELHNDVEGILTEFIAAMPEEEEAMSLSEWIVHNASTCRRTIEEATQNIIQGYMEEFDKVIAHVEQLDTID